MILIKIFIVIGAGFTIMLCAIYLGGLYLDWWHYKFSKTCDHKYHPKRMYKVFKTVELSNDPDRE